MKKLLWIVPFVLLVGFNGCATRRYVNKRIEDAISKSESAIITMWVLHETLKDRREIEKEEESK